ncbi:MAG: VapC toxin family PIN domain ribonuclease [Desulfobacterales bacterium CG23_combo_of_CG06-09_8_20_14_all_51_8]|nr:MAG: VapC toxin family PIN domain ribonuclease [Desulfobacterales bacterium CG23_combo_of_CG06-09_8_20_14_all_51_8]
MPGPEAVFIDSNVLLYLLSEDADKADQAEAIVRSGGRISVQILNEIANVARRKLSMPWGEINELLSLIRYLCPVEPLTIETHEQGIRIARQYKLSTYDAMIVAAALIAGCEVLYSEDMQNGLLVDNQLHIRNPFISD